ncbi:MAG: NTP transferase domain-containing protein, partial [Rhodocyclaceae bacterium]|nr:NTP transferase domain-containing protein [Rhodocyclaceae bacterium]
MSAPYSVFIPCAGLGTRMGALTTHLNKSLVSVGGKPALARVIDQFGPDARLVVALGYKGSTVREFLELAYAERDIAFVEVAPFEGPGSGLGHTLRCAEPLLREPFVFCSCDTLVAGGVPLPDRDWAGWAVVDAEGMEAYRTLEIAGGRVLRVNPKGCDGPASRAYIGLAGIHDWRGFWSAMAEGGDRAVAEGEAWGLDALAAAGRVEAVAFDWTDVGTREKLAAVDDRYVPEVRATILPKENEAIWFVNGLVVKFSDDARFIRDRVARVAGLAGWVPELTGHRANMYAYRRVEGSILSEAVTLPVFERLLDRCRDFWRPAALSAGEMADFRARCRKFYRDKTLDRLAAFYERFGKADGALSINGAPAPPLAGLLDRVDWDGLADGLPGRFHGDFHFENILLAGDGRFVFLDWRQEFCGDLAVGDVYYDLAKLLHGLIVNH